MLKFSYSQIKNSRNPLTHVDENVELSKEFFDRSKELLEDANNVHVTGDFFYDEPFVTPYENASDILKAVLVP